MRPLGGGFWMEIKGLDKGVCIYGANRGMVDNVIVWLEMLLRPH